MSEPTLKFRKTPKTPFLAGNLLLAALGAGLVFLGPDPFSVATVLLVALCLATGGLLTLLPFLLDQFALQTLQRTRFSQAAANLRGIMERSEEILDRLDEAETESNPIRLVSERLPDLVEEKIREALANATSEADEQRKNILSIVTELNRLPDDLEKLHDDLRVLSSHSATREFLGTGLENLEAKLHRLEVILNEAKRSRLFGTGEATTDAGASSGPSGDPGPTSVPEKKPDPGPEPSSEPTVVEAKPEKKDRASTEAGNKPTENPENETVAKRSSPKRSRKTEIIVAAFVGIQNGIYLRGNGPGMSPEQGVRMEMTGIGEWAWSGESKERFTAELFLNDENPSSLGSFSVSPGDVLKLNPTFETGK